MSQLNLLPWRLEHKKIRNRVFYSILFLCVGIVFVVFLSVYAVIKEWQNKERVNLGYLQSEIQKTLEQVKEVANLKSQKAALIKGMDLIHALEDARFSLVYVLDTIVRVTPAGLWLTELSRTENQIQIQGLADTNASISELLKNLEQPKNFRNVKLSEIKHHKKQAGLFFKVELECLSHIEDGEKETEEDEESN